MKKRVSHQKYNSSAIRFGIASLTAILFFVGLLLSPLRSIIQPTARAATFTVSKTADTNDGACDADCSLREAITAANANADADIINFNIAAAPFTIQPTSALPNISQPVTIDGTSQPGFAGVPIIEINGANDGGFGDGLHVFAGGVVIKSLIINGFSGDGIKIGFSSGSTVTGCYIGTNASGTAAVPNGKGINLESASNNTIGGATLAARNLISGNNGDGISIFVGFSSANNNQIKGNFIGTQADGATALGNGGDGIEARGNDGISVPTVIGGTATGEANIIAFNVEKGINVESGGGVNIRGNSIFSNNALGIDLGTDGVAVNDACDADNGDNGLTLQNYPTISAVSSAGGLTTIDGALNSKANQTFTLDFFASDASDASGFGEGKTFLGSTMVTTDGSCAATFTANFAATLTTGNAVSATATDSLGNTSEFSQVFIFGALPTDVSVTKNDSADPVAAGDSFDYIITVANGAETAFNANMTDAVPSAFSINSVMTTQGTCAQSGNTVSCTFGDFAPGGGVTVTINVTANEAGNFSNTATVGLSNPDPNPANNSDTETTLVQGADLSIDKTDSIDPATSGTNFDYVLTVTNNGALTATNVFVSDSLPSGVSFVSASAGCTESFGFVQCSLGNLANGATAMITITVTPTQVGNLSNTADVTSDINDPNTANNSDTETTLVQGADLALTKTAAPEPAQIGSPLIYTLTVTNNGPAIANNVRIVDTLPTLVDFVSASEGCAPNQNNQLTLNLGTIAVGQMRTATITVIPRDGTSATNTATVSTTTGDHVSGNNTASATSNFGTNGNASAYAFSTATNETFVSTVGGTTISSGVALGSTFFLDPAFDIGFEFYFMGRRFRRFSVSPDGFIELGEPNSVSTPPLGQADRTDVVIAPFGSNQNLNSSSRVRTIVTGVAPNRVRVVSWTNISSDAAGTTADLNYQVLLHESSGIVKFIYGAAQMSATAAANSNSNQVNIGFSVDDEAGKIGSVAAPQNSASVSYNSTAAAPTVNLYNTAGAIASLNSTADGSRRVFQFTPVSAPNAPGNLSFSNVSQTAMTLNWNDNSSDENGFAIYRSTDGANFSFVGQANANQTSLNANGLDPNTNYFWQVSAFGIGTLSAAATGNQTTLAANNVAANAAGGNWSNPATWATGVVPTAADNVSIPAGATVIIDADARVLDLSISGVLEFESVTARHLQAKNTTIAAGGALQVPAAGSQFNHEICVGGNLTNNGTLDLHANPSCCNRPAARLTFAGSKDATLGGSGATTDVSKIVVFKPNLDTPATAAHTLEIVSSNFTVRSLSNGDAFGFAFVRAGILKISGTFTLSSILLTPEHLSSSIYTLGTNQSLWLNNPNFTWLSNVNSHNLNGFVRLSAVNAGSFVEKPTIENLIVEGGSIRFLKVGIRNYTQTGGTITILGGDSFDGGDPPFSIQSAGSSMTMSGGSIVFQTPQPSLFPNPTPTDFINLAAQQNLTGGTVQFGNVSSGAAKTFTMCGNVFNLVINNQSAGHTVRNTCGVRVLGDTTINANTILNVGGISESFSPEGASFINNGSLRVASNTNIVSAFLFGGTVAQTYSGSGTAGTAATPLARFDISNVGGGVTISPASPTIITSRVNLFTGTFINSGKIQIGAGGATSAIIQRGNGSAQITPSGAFDTAPIFNVGSGGLGLFYGIAGASLTTGNEIPPSRTVRQLLVDGSNSIILNGGDLTLDGTSGTRTLELVNGIFETGANTLFVKPSITVTRTNGWVNGNLKMEYNAVGSKVFHAGTANGYSPVTANVTTLATNPSSLTVKAIQGAHPNVPNEPSALKRYWSLTESGDLTATLTFQYIDNPPTLTDVPTGIAENSLELKRYTGAGTIFDTVPATLNTTANTATTTSGITDFSDWTIDTPVSPSAAPATISGQVTTSDGTALEGVLMTLAGGNVLRRTITNGAGFYQFPDVDTDAFYSVSPLRANYAFAPAEHSFSLLANKTDAVFMARALPATTNPLDTPEYFVRQQYLDFLGREPDQGGLDYWSAELRACGSDQRCLAGRRMGVSGAFFVEQEFQQTGSFVYRIYEASLGRQPSYAEFSADRAKVIGGASLEEQRVAFADEWVSRASFQQVYPASISAADFVNRLFDSAGLLPYSAERQQQIEAMAGGKTRAQVLRDVIDTGEFKQREYNPSFVLMQYFGYLRRDPDQGGYDFWLDVLNNREPGNFRGMVCSFITSAEYQQRFSTVVTRSNAHCGN